MMKQANRFLICIPIIIAVFITSVLFGCDNDDSKETEEPQETQTIEVQRGDLITTISAFGNVSMPHRANLSFGVGGTLKEINVDFGDIVSEGDILARLDTDSLQRSIALAQSDLRMAEINLERASSDASILQAQAALESAQSNLQSAEELLRQSQDFSLSDAQTALENAQRNLTTAEKNAELSVAAAEKQYEDAREAWGEFVQLFSDILDQSHIAEQKDELWDAVEDAEKNLEVVKETAATAIANAELAVTAAENALSNTPLGIKEKEAAVASAKAAVINAENNLAYVQAGMDIELLQISVDKATIALEDAQDRLDDATVTAPFDGTIASVNAIEGDQIMAGAIVMQLVDSSEIEIGADVDEIDVAKVEIGQEAEISIDAVPSSTFPGEVTAVTPVGRNQAGLITYDITIGINDTLGANLKDGMTASADIYATIAQNALLIPKAAITRDRAAGIHTVTVVNENGSHEVREVQTGASNGKLTEITSGLKDGESIVSSVSIAVSRGSGSSGSPDGGGSDDVDIMECMAKLQDIMPCTETLMKMGEELGMDPAEYGDEIPWDEIEYYANDDSGEVPKDIKECLSTLLDNRDCLEAMMQMAEDMGIDPSQYSGGMGGFGGM